MSSIFNSESAEQIFIQLLKESKIACTYSQIRELLKWLMVEKKYWSSLEQKLRVYQGPDIDNDTVYVLCQVARGIAGDQLMQFRPDLRALSSYAVGIVALLSDNNPLLPLKPALEHLLSAYTYEKAFDTQIAILIIYERLGYFDLSHSLVESIIRKLAKNLKFLLKLPSPLKIEDSYYDKVRDVGEKIEDIIDKYLEIGKIKEAEEQLLKIKRNLRNNKVPIPELEFNLALCRTLQKDFDESLGALKYLEEMQLILKQIGTSKRASKPRQAYYQLTIYVYYYLGRFEELQSIVIQGINEDFQPWLQTLLGYILLKTGNHQLSKEIIQKNSENLLNKLKDNILSLEYILIYLYFQSDLQISREKLIKLLHKQFLNSSTSIQDTTKNKNFSVRLFPSPETLDFQEINQHLQDYEVPDDTLAIYEQKSGLQASTNGSYVTKKLSDLALRSVDLQKAKGILLAYWRENPVEEQAADLVISFYYDFLLPANDLNGFIDRNPQLNVAEMQPKLQPKIIKLKELLEVGEQEIIDQNKYPTNNQVNELIEKWIKSEHEREIVGANLIKLLNQSKSLRRLYWNRKDLRQQIWQALDISIDYANITLDILPRPLTLEALENTVFHLLYVGMHQRAREIIKDAKKQLKPNDNKHQYLDKLDTLSQEEPSVYFHNQIYYLCQFSGLYQYVSLSDIQPDSWDLMILALSLLVEYPDDNRQAYQRLLLAELQEAKDLSNAIVNYKKLIESNKIYVDIRLQAALRFMRLCVIDITNNVTWSANLAINEKTQIVLDALAKFLPPLDKEQEQREHLAKVLKQLQIVVQKLHSQKEYDTSAIKSMLGSLSHLTNADYRSDCSLEIYKYLIGKEPVQGENPQAHNLQDVLYLFLDYEVKTLGRGKLKEQVNLTLETIIQEYEMKERSNINQQGTILIDSKNEWLKIQENINNSYLGNGE